MAQINDIFGSLVFDERTMKAVLPAKVFASLKKTIDEDTPLDPSVADVVAQAMKEW
ncbi:MAG: glutamine synthetase III, partial [Treponema sp.]|nr:glutamine synthetase III [Treponema sp.]